MAYILIVDDQPPARFLVRRVLESEQHTISEADDGLKALRLMDETDTPFDLILLDLRMPNLDGFEFLSMLRLRRVRPPVIVLTALWNMLPSMSDYAVSGYLSKPFTRQQLLNLVHQTLNAPAR